MKKILALMLFSVTANAATQAENFPTRLYLNLSETQAGKNFAFSPHSISQAFSLADLGARGETRSEIESNISLNKPLSAGSDDSGQLSSANRIWIQNSFKVLPTYLEESKTKANATPGIVDFTDPKKAADTINSWVENQTHGKIKDLVPASVLGKSSRLVLTNAVYFKASWEEPFQKQATKDDDFELEDGEKVRVPFMHQRHRFHFQHNREMDLVTLPYANYKYEMTIILPAKGITLAQFEKSFSVEKLNEWTASGPSGSVQLSLPRFKFDSDFTLNEPIKKLGVLKAFEPYQADLSGIDGRKDLYIADAFHKAFVAVDELGTEAAAATALHVKMAASMELIKPWEMNVNRPFLFVIREIQSKEILFLGRVVNPK